VGPVDYLRILRRHWRVALGLVVVALGVAFVTSPSDSGPAYEATNVIGRERQAAGEVAAPALEGGVKDLLADPELARRAAASLSYDDDVDRLADAVTATADPRRGAVAVMAVADAPGRAVSVVNAFADALVGVLNSREAERTRAAVEEAAAEEQALRDDLARLQADLATAGDDADEVQAEIDDVAGRLGTIAAVPATPSTVYASLQPADEPTPVDAFVAGGTRPQRLLLATVVGVLLAAGVVITIDRADGRIVTRQHAERRFDLPVISEVPLLPVRDRHRAAVYAFHRHDGMGEAYRGLSAALGHPDPEFHDDDITTWSGNLDDVPAGRRVIVVTSAEHRDGKSTTSANLAIAYAQAGEKTLLVQWDLVRPLPARVLGADEGAGVADFVDDATTPLAGMLQETSVPGLRFVPAGGIDDDGDPPSDRIANLLAAAGRAGDVVIVDTAPVLLSGVTRQLVTLADVVIVTCHAGGTSGPGAERCAELLVRLEAPTVGVVLVGVPAGRSGGVAAVEKVRSLLRPSLVSG